MPILLLQQGGISHSASVSLLSVLSVLRQVATILVLAVFQQASGWFTKFINANTNFISPEQRNRRAIITYRLYHQAILVELTQFQITFVRFQVVQQ